MKLVVDTNILFSFFWENSVTRKFIINSSLELVSPITAIKELEKYSDEIIKKARITKKEFDLTLKEMKLYVKFIEKGEYQEFVIKAKDISPDEADADFLALCIKFSCCLWSNDNILKNQDKIRVLSIKDILELLL